MAKLPRRPPPQKRKTDLPAGEVVASLAVLPKKRDPRQLGIFDAPLPPFIAPQLAKLVTEAPEGERWAHELKFDGYRMHARIDRGRVQLITARSGLDGTGKYRATAEALKQLPVSRAYLDGELCAVRDDGTTSFSLMQAATDGESAAGPPPAKPTPNAARRGSDTHGVPRENILQPLPEAIVPSREQLERYWRKVARRALPYLVKRPPKLVRHVHGITFYHRGKLPPVPNNVHQLTIERREGGAGTRVWIDDLDGLLGLLDTDVIEVHPWGATVDAIEHPDTFVFDLDPGEGIEWPFVQDTALRLREMLEAEEGLVTWPKLTGGKGVHIMVPIERGRLWNAAHDYCRRTAERCARKDPARYTTSAKMSDRPGKLFIDYLRNGRGTTAVGTYSPRARAGFRSPRL